MKVAHLSSIHKPNDNRIFYKECMTLAKEGYDVTLVVAGAEDKVFDNLKVVGYSKAKGGRIKRMVWTSFVDMLRVAKRIDADIYHFHDPELIFVGLYLKAKGKKVIYDIHENNPASILSKPYIKSKLVKRFLSKSFNLFEQGVVRYFDALVTARPDISKRFSHPNVVTLRNFPILPKNLATPAKKEIQKAKPSIIYVGGMDALRGTHELLDAFALLEECELWLLGPIGEKNLEERIQKGCKNVRYFGVVEAYEVFDYIAKADIGIITFLEAPNHIQTLATKPFEYMACGKPMIVSDFPYWRETFKESALYVDPSNPKEIAKRVKALLADKDLMDKMARLNLSLSQKEYNWERESQKLIQLYRTLNR